MRPACARPWCVHAMSAMSAMSAVSVVSSFMSCARHESILLDYYYSRGARQLLGQLACPVAWAACVPCRRALAHCLLGSSERNSATVPSLYLSACPRSKPAQSKQSGTCTAAERAWGTGSCQAPAAQCRRGRVQAWPSAGAAACRRGRVQAWPRTGWITITRLRQ